MFYCLNSITLTDLVGTDCWLFHGKRSFNDQTLMDGKWDLEETINQFENSLSNCLFPYVKNPKAK